MVFPVVPDSSNYRVWFFIGVSPSWPDHFTVMADLIGHLSTKSQTKSKDRLSTIL